MAKLYIVACLLIVAASIRAEEVAEGTALTAQKYVREEQAGQVERDKLFDDLFTNYRKDSHPENVTVQFGLTLFDATLDQDKNALNTVAWLTIVWNDHRLSWNQEERRVRALNIPPSKVWLPDIALYNSMDQGLRQACEDSNVFVKPSGEIMWVPACQFTSFCNLTLDKYPHGEQVCTLKFASWTYDGNAMGLELNKNNTHFDMDNYLGPPSYKITQNSAVKNVKKYDCCPDPYPEIIWTLGLKKVDQAADKTCDVKN